MRSHQMYFSATKMPLPSAYVRMHVPFQSREFGRKMAATPKLIGLRMKVEAESYARRHLWRAFHADATTASRHVV